MSALDLVEDAATGGWRVYLKLALKVAPYVVAAGLAVALVITRGTLRDVRQQIKLDAAQAQVVSANMRAGFADQITKATQGYADKLAAREPIILRATDTVREYAQTPAGRAVCASADLVRSTDVLDQQLGLAPGSAQGR